MAIEIAAMKREQMGSAASRRLRHAGRVPAVIYNRQGVTRLVDLDKHAFQQMLLHHTSENLIVDVQINGEVLGKALLKEVQHDPVSGHVLHADFLEISMTEKLRVNIAVESTGTAVGVEQGGGILEHVLRQIEVECLPGDLVESFQVDVSALKVGDSMLVRDLNLGDKYAVLTPEALAVFLVSMPKQEEEVVAAPGAEATEPEVIARKAKEDAEAAPTDAKAGAKPSAAGDAKGKAGADAKGKAGGEAKGGKAAKG